MAAADIHPGDVVLATDAFAHENRRRAISPIMEGQDFAVVWVCREEEWQAALAADRQPEGIPFPVEDVRLAEAAHAE